MTKQTIYDPALFDFSKNIRERNIFDIRKTLGDLTKFGKEFVSKNYHAEEKDEKSIWRTI